LRSARTAFGTLAAGVPSAQAQTQFPVKPIRLIVGSAAGSGPDIIGRAMADRLGETWGQRMIVDPRPGRPVRSAPTLRWRRRRTATP
jgi:tripartite-type tricarboxylate transporter receptor subunit TctC